MRTKKITLALRAFILALGIFINVANTIVYAETLQLKSADGQILNAEYLSGDTSRPAILVLHGFLQTNEFLATHSIISSLSSLGYTVVGPNFSLGIPSRQQSMQCQAPHRHTFEEDLREIDFWLGWLRSQGYSRVIIVGHSWGSQHALGYAESHPNSMVIAIIAVSLVHVEQVTEIRKKQIRQAKARLSKQDQSLQPYALSFCKAFMATPPSYLSYARWNDTRVIESLTRLQNKKLPVYVVLGSEDNRIDDSWPQQLRAHAAQVTVIEGANHFFSSVYEFELSDQLETILAHIHPGTK